MSVDDLLSLADSYADNIQLSKALEYRKDWNNSDLLSSLDFSTEHPYWE